jgi:SNF2 family DNA or RNA helicase
VSNDEDNNPGLRKSSRQSSRKLSNDAPISYDDDEVEGFDDEEEFIEESGNIVSYSKRSLKKTHQLKWSECEESIEEGFKYMSQYLTVFEPFITSKVYDKLKGFHDLFAKNKKLKDVYHNDDIESIQQPSTIINCTLRDYQLDGISWIVDRYDKAINVILADEMVLYASYYY